MENVQNVLHRGRQQVNPAAQTLDQAMHSASSIASQRRTRRVLACEACRSKRTRCDGRKPTCSSCETRSIDCNYPETNERGAPDLESEVAAIRTQLDRIERVVNASNLRRTPATSPQSLHQIGSVNSAHSPGILSRDFPFMTLHTTTFTRMAGLGDDFGNHLLRLERNEIAPEPSIRPSIFMLQHANVMTALQAYCDRVHPWYPILGTDFSACVSSFMSNSFSRSSNAFLVLMVLASGALALEQDHKKALETRPDTAYLNAALEMLHLVVFEQSLRSVQCLAVASIHYCLLLKPLQAHDLAVIASKKAQDLHLTGAFQGDHAQLEHWIRVYRVIILIESELAVQFKVADSNAWQFEEDIPLPTSTDVWSGRSDDSGLLSTDSLPSSSIDSIVTYLLAEVAMRRMLRRCTSSVSFSVDGSVEYAPIIARELEAQLEQWYAFLPEPLRFSFNFDDSGASDQRRPHTTFLCAQYWACMASIYWPSVVKAMESNMVAQSTLDKCANFFQSYKQFVSAAIAVLPHCLPNKWTLYASIFAITIGAFLGASNPALATIAEDDTWTQIRAALNSFDEECRCSPSLFVLKESMLETLSSADAD